MNDSWLVMADVDAVQSYLFSSLHLREIAGASTLLVEHDAAIHDIARRLDKNAEVLFSAGGTALVAFQGVNAARSFAEEVRRNLSARAPGAGISFGGPRRVVDGFPSARDEVARDLERNKRLGQDRGEAAGCPLAAPCEGCGREPAVDGGHVQAGSDWRWLGSACLRKHEARERGSWLDLMRDREGWGSVGSHHLSRDTGDLAGEELLAVVVADADGAGEKLRGVVEAADYRAFSEALSGSVRATLVAAIDAVASPSTADRLPVDVLYAGGDDVVVACRGDLALRFARVFTEGFIARMGRQGRPLGMSAAVSLVGPTFPFRLAHDIATGLLRGAKQEARRQGWQEGAIDWAVITESQADVGTIIADRELRVSDRALLLSGRPYRAVPSGKRSIGSLEEACAELRRGFPRNKLFSLRSLCSAGELFGPTAPAMVTDIEAARSTFKETYREWHERAQRAAGDRWKAACTKLYLEPADPCWADGGESRTPIGDLAEGISLWGTP